MNLKALIVTIAIIFITYIVKTLFGIQVAISTYFFLLLIFIKINN
jgi:hypothetical protein